MKSLLERPLEVLPEAPDHRRHLLEGIIERLPAKLRHLLVIRAGLAGRQTTQRELGQALAVSNKRVSQLEKLAIERMANGVWRQRIGERRGRRSTTRAREDVSSDGWHCTQAHEDAGRAPSNRGGGGGSYCGIGGASGAESGTASMAGAVCGKPEITPLVGELCHPVARATGSPGGGGAIQLIAGTSTTIDATG
jgi:hypothetical protein